jgi:hypothetical protein
VQASLWIVIDSQSLGLLPDHELTGSYSGPEVRLGETKFVEGAYVLISSNPVSGPESNRKRLDLYRMKIKISSFRPIRISFW